MTPDTYTNQELFLEVGHGHELYVHDWGNKAARTAIIYLHGGPGGGTNDRKKRLFDPARQRVVFFDQRGSGRSLPYGSLEHNTTADIVEDITRIADRLKLKTFILRGGSWGATLALAYGIKYPERVKAMVLDGIYTASKDEADWLNQGLFQTFYPDVWQRYLDRTPKRYHKDPSSYHIPRILGDKPQATKESGYAYYCMEGGALSLGEIVHEEPFDDFDPTAIRTEVHYTSQGCFLPDRYILDNAHKLTMPIYLVQGRYDMICPPNTAYELSLRAPQSELFLTTSGHYAERESTTLIRALLLDLSK